MIAVVALSLFGQVASAPPVPVRVEHGSELLGTRQIPNEIAPAIVPYANCLLGLKGVALRVEGKAVANPIPVGTDCAAQRAAAARAADAMLDRQGRGTAAERKAYVERVLEREDHALDDIPPGVPAGMAAPTRVEDNAPSDYPIAIMDEVERYGACINAQAHALLGQGGPADGSIIRAAFASAKLACARTRGEVMHEADIKLARDGMAESERARTIGAFLADVESGGGLADRVDAVDGTPSRQSAGAGVRSGAGMSFSYPKEIGDAVMVYLSYLTHRTNIDGVAAAKAAHTAGMDSTVVRAVSKQVLAECRNARTKAANDAALLWRKAGRTSPDSAAETEAVLGTIDRTIVAQADMMEGRIKADQPHP